MVKQINIIGAGYDLNRIPTDYVFKNDTFALNVSAIAPQFYDYDTDKYHHSWTYSIMVDPVIAKPHYFPEYLYFKAAINNKSGITYIASGVFKRNNISPSHFNGVRILPDKKYRQVILPALDLIEGLSYERIVLVACPYCTMGENGLMRYWWEDTDYCDKIMKHPKNRGAVKAQGVKIQKVTKSGKNIEALDRKNMRANYIKELDTGNNNVRITRFQNNQRKIVESKIAEMVKSGIEIVKFGNTGMLKLDVEDNLYEL